MLPHVLHTRKRDRFFRWPLLSLAFGTAVVGSFYILQIAVVPVGPYGNEIVTFLFILLSVFILFPARDFVMRRFLEKSEYAALFGRDFHHLDFIARPFTMEALIHEIYPELMDWLGVRSGKLMILESRRRHFHIYIHHRTHVHRSPDVHHGRGALSKYAVGNPGAIHAQDEGLPQEIADLMAKYRARYLIPFLYRNRLFGFLLLAETPRHPHARRALSMFAGKAAASIHNSILTSKIIDTQTYARELEGARHVQHWIKTAKLLELPHYEFRQANTSYPCILELFPGQDGRHQLVAVSSPRPSSAAYLALASVLGRLFSHIRNRKSGLEQLVRFLKKGAAFTRMDFPLDLLVAEIDGEKITFLADGRGFRLEGTTLEPGAKTVFSQKAGDMTNLCYRGMPLLEIIYAGFPMTNIRQRIEYMRNAASPHASQP